MTARVVVIEIPAEDVKGPASMLTRCNMPHHQPSDETPSSIDLPDYFTAVQNIDEAYSSLGTGLEEEDTPRTPPPCYQEAIEMEPWQTIPV